MIDMKAHYARGEAHHKRDLNTVNRNVMAGLKETKRIRLVMNPTSGEQQLDGNKGNEIHDDRIDCNAKHWSSGMNTRRGLETQSSEVIHEG